MTYILGWKDQAGNVYLCADSVATSANTDEQINESTSFRETHVNTPRRQVSERLLKLVNLQRIAIAISGNFRTGIEIVQLIQSELQRGVPARQAFRNAVISHCPMRFERSVALLAAIPEGDSAALLTFNVHDNEEFAEPGIGGHAHVGSIGAWEKAFAFATIREIAKWMSSRPSVISLASTLAIQQGLGVREYLLEKHSAGGSVCGLRASGQAILWQPDLLYIPYATVAGHPKVNGIVWSAIRDNRLVVRSTLSNTCRVFANSFAGQEQVEADWLANSGHVLHQRMTELPFDYVVMLNNAWANVTLVEMRGQEESRYLKIPDSKTATVGIQLSPELHNVMVTPKPEDPKQEAKGWFPSMFNFLAFE